MDSNVFKPYNICSIRNIVFDLGGVILDIDFNLTFEAYRKLGASNLDSYFTLAKQSELFNRFDCGLVSPALFIEELRGLLGLTLPDTDIIAAWNELLLPWDMRRLELLDRLRGSFNLYLLSNTNKLHFDLYNAQLMEQTGGRSLSDYFTKAYYSFELGMRKPNSEIYQFVLDDSHLNPSETLFIDDLPQNTATASDLGIITYNINPNEETILDLF